MPLANSVKMRSTTAAWIVVDLAAAMDELAAGIMLPGDVVAIAEPAARPALAHPALQATADLLCQVLQEQGVHGPLQADVQLVDLALGQRHQFDAGEGEVLEQGGDVLLVAGEPVEGLGDDDVEGAGAGVLQQLLVARPKPAGTRARGVAIGREQRPALPIDPLPADPNLVLDRGLALEIGGIPGVNDSAHGRARTSRSPCSISCRPKRSPARLRRRIG